MNTNLQQVLLTALNRVREYRQDCQTDGYNALAESIIEEEQQLALALYHLDHPTQVSEATQAEAYRQMHETATQDLGYPSILEALEAAPHADAQAPLPVYDSRSDKIAEVSVGLDGKTYLVFSNSGEASRFLDRIGCDSSKAYYECFGNFENAFLISDRVDPAFFNNSDN